MQTEQSGATGHLDIVICHLQKFANAPHGAPGTEAWRRADAAMAVEDDIDPGVAIRWGRDVLPLLDGMLEKCDVTPVAEGDLGSSKWEGHTRTDSLYPAN